MPTYIYFDESTKHGAMLRSLLRTLESGDDGFTDMRDMMIQMREGQNGSQDSHYAPHVKFFRFGGYSPTQGDPTPEQLQMARTAFEEADSAYNKTRSDTMTIANSDIQDVGGGFSIVTTNTRAARDQLFARMR